MAHEIFNFLCTWMIFVLLIALKTGSVISELYTLLAIVLSISKFSSSLLKCLLKIFASSSLLVIALLLLFEIIDPLSEAFSENRGPTVFQNFLLSKTTLWSSVPKKTSFNFAEQANTVMSLAIKTLFRFSVSSF